MTTSYNGKEYTITGEIGFDGLQDVRIDDSIYVVDNDHVSAACVDESGAEHIAYWEVNTAYEMDDEEFADWDNATYVAKA